MNDTDPDRQTTHFGFETVPLGQKAQRVRLVFDSVATRYDLMNDCMSLGVHRLWKALATYIANVRPGAQVLDLAAGTGDLTARLARLVGPEGRVVAADVNESMLRVGRARLLDRGVAGNVVYVQADGERLPFPAGSFDCAMIAFGLRNITRKDQALAAMYRVLKPGGQALVLEFSHPRLAVVRRLYDEYSFRVLPWLGRQIAGDADSYRYLAESIRRHPDQEHLKAMMEEAGFEHCDFLDLSAGIVALHRGYKF